MGAEVNNNTNEKEVDKEEQIVSSEVCKTSPIRNELPNTH